MFDIYALVRLHVNRISEIDAHSYKKTSNVGTEFLKNWSGFKTINSAHSRSSAVHKLYSIFHQTQPVNTVLEFTEHSQEARNVNVVTNKSAGQICACTVHDKMALKFK